MTLAERIGQLRNESLSALDSVHDYYSHTKSAWRFVQEVIEAGQPVTMHNQLTGSRVESDDLPALAQSYVSGYLASATFQEFVSTFENFLINLYSLWLTEYPHTLGKQQLTFQDVLDAADKETIVRFVVQRKALDLAHQRIDRWFREINNLVNLKCPSQQQIDRLAEIKASRDVIVHNKGIANDVYVERSSGLARYQPGRKLEVPEPYHRQTWELLKQVIGEISNAVVAKVGHP